MFFLFFQAEDGIRDRDVTGVQTCALPIWRSTRRHVRAQTCRLYSERVSAYQRPLDSAHALLRVSCFPSAVRAASGRLDFRHCLTRHASGLQKPISGLWGLRPSEQGEAGAHHFSAVLARARTNHHRHTPLLGRLDAGRRKEEDIADMRAPTKNKSCICGRPLKMSTFM